MIDLDHFFHVDSESLKGWGDYLRKRIEGWANYVPFYKKAEENIFNKQADYIIKRFGKK